jgi:hypothetical protein
LFIVHVSFIINIDKQIRSISKGGIKGEHGKKI